MPGTETSTTYDANGRIIKAVDEEGYEVSFTYDADGRQTAVKNARGYSTAYEYDACGNITVITDALGGRTTSVYDANHNLISTTDAEGCTTSYTYDKLGRVTSTTGANGTVTTVIYDANGNIVKLTQADGREITYSYNARNELTSYVDAAGYTHSFTYDGNGNVTSETDGNGNTTTYTYDALNRAVSAKNGEDGISEVIYDADGRLISMTDAEGYVTTFTYDAMDRVVTITDAKGGVTRYTYTDRGEVVTKTDAEGYVTSYEYDGNGNCVKMTTVDGETLYEYDPLDRLIMTTTPDGESTSVSYDGVGNVTASTDANGNTTRYVYDGKGNVTETIDALGNSALFEYDSIGNLVKTSLHRVDTQDNVDEWEVTLYEFDGRGLTTKQVDALGNVTTYAYDGNGNLVSKTDPDGYTTEYTYNALDLVTSINYNDAKEVSYRYNATGDLVSMTDWLGTTTFELDLLHRLTAATDHAGKRVEYTYDGVGNQTSIAYPDGTTAAYDYDLMGNQTKVTETDGSETEYTYDGMGRVTEMRYPNGWVEYYTYDAMGRILAVEDTHPSEKPAKTQKHTYRYDANGNMTYEYMRGNGTGQAKNETLYTYDALNRLISAHDNYGNSTRTYTYDSLGNLTYETGNGSHNMDYRYNNLNQLVEQSDDGWKAHTTSAYDNRGNLILETYHKGNKASVTGAYTYDETNKMVRGINDIGESSSYLYNGLGALMENTWGIKKNAYGYHDVRASAVVDGETVVDFATGKKEKKEKKTAEEVAASPALNKTSTVVKQFVVDFTSETYKPLMEHEVNGLDYRYVYSDKARLSVVVQGIENGSASVLDSSGELHAYYHCDYLGTTDYLTSAVNSKVISWTSYNEWGEITHNAVLKCGQRELDLVKEYATHDFDAVLNQYYAKARFYDADNRRFTAVDPIKDGLNWYTYCTNNPVMWLDPWGLVAIINGNTFGTRSLKDSVYGYESEYATFQDLVTAYGGYVSTGTDRSGISYLQGHIYNGQANGSIMLNYFLSGSNKGQLIARDGSHKVSFDTSKLAMRGETAYVNVAYFHKLMCDFGRQASFNIGTRNTGLTSAEINAATQAYGLSATQVAALKKINDYYYDNPMLANKDTTVFAFEGVSHSLNETINSKSPWYRYHPWGQFDAMFVSVRNGQIVALTKNASTLPDDPTRSGSYVMKEGLYSLLPFRHRGYAATEVRNFSGDDEVPTYLYGKDGGTVNGIDLHVSYSYDRSHKSNTMYWTTPSTWSQGCLTVNISDYIQFGAATGFLNGNSYDYYADYGLSNKENWDYTTFKANFKYETYGNKSFSGNLVVDRSALRNKISATGNKELLKYYFGE